MKLAAAPGPSSAARSRESGRPAARRDPPGSGRAEAAPGGQGGPAHPIAAWRWGCTPRWRRPGLKDAACDSRWWTQAWRASAERPVLWMHGNLLLCTELNMYKLHQVLVLESLGYRFYHQCRQRTTLPCGAC
ncbi:uncharacterized protein [Narcine bancroftii]|uniref:uncharacterized protein isoform X2 n=1 Tax=Narcine bancroftii TaxID=1343680 RepID=UPI0038322DD7